MKNLSVILIALVIVVESVASKRSSTIPLNFFEEIQKLNTLLRNPLLLSSDQKRQLLKPSTIKSLLWSPQVKIPIENIKIVHFLFLSLE